MGWNIERLQSWRVPDTLGSLEDVAIYGESMWTNFVAEQLGLKLYEPPLNWLAQLPESFVRRRVEFLELSGVRDKAFPLFVKPAGDKTFEARVYNSPDELPAPKDERESTPVLTSKPVRWEVEYRCFICEGRVETLSSYWRREDSTRISTGEYVSPPLEMEEARDFANEVVNSQSAKEFGERGVVVDVGIIEDVGWAVIEANPAYASGIYGCDPERVLSVVASCTSVE